MTDGKDGFEKALSSVLSRNRLKAVSSQGQSIRSLHSTLSILTVHQASEVIVNLAVSITSFTRCAENYCEIWHKEISNDIQGIRAMLEILEHAYQKVDATLQETKKT